MEIIFKSQPRKYLQSVPESTREKLLDAINGIPQRKGDIKKLAGQENMYRLKIHHYRVLFMRDADNNLVIITTINTRTNIKY